ncbi:MAG: DUF983 domain-containing protein [Planctomycetota bacterium]|nr:DUF983 domain-containing protein [Planctomycetota bacterium]
MPNTEPISLGTSLYRALRLRCPLCGRGKLFRNWIRMPENCAHCQLKFQRGPGYYLGSVYVNYGLTAVLVTIGYFALFFSEVMSNTMQLVCLVTFCVLFPLWFFRYARALWLALDLYLDPGQLDGEPQARR